MQMREAQLVSELVVTRGSVGAGWCGVAYIYHPLLRWESTLRDRRVQ